MPREELITVQGKPLSEYVKEMEQEEEANRQRLKGMEIAHHRKDIMQEQKKSCYYDVKDKATPKTRFKRFQKNSRVVSLPDDRIRKEYGIMSKKFGSTVENIIWVMINKGPITSKEIADELGKKRKQLTGTISDLKRSISKTYMKTKMIKEKKGRPLTYHIIDISQKDAYKTYRKAMNKKRKQAAMKQNRSCELSSGTTQKPEAPVSEDTSKLVGKLTEYIEGKLKDIGMNVNVSGQIDVVFSIGDGAKMNMEVKK